jgi:type VI secretion system protein ImpL
MLSFLKRRGFLIFVGFVLLALFIWYAGPYFAFADYYPLESPFARIVLIGAVILVWIVTRLLRRLRAYLASNKLAAAVVSQAAAQPERPSAEAAQLRERFEEAIATLKQSRQGTHLYDLPWYVIIGAPGSGKTTALLNSGLKFPLEQRVGKGALRGIGGTRNCDWWFTDEAVFLDTAGRYTTQDSDAASDSASWAEFLALLRKYRKRRPINGVILTISAQDLMMQGGLGREAHVEAARRRLNELNRDLHIQLPVYLMVTKCDLVAGFAEYFDDLTQEGRAQVWGVTFPYEQTLKGEAVHAFPPEFDQLIARLNARVFARVEEDRDPRRRARVFAFPQQMAALRAALSEFATEVFASTRLDQQILLRGVYFTSGTQEGTPIDRLLGAIGRRYGVASDAVVPPTGRGKAYFVERLLKEVLIGESGLAGVNRRLELKKAALQLGAYAAMALIAVGGLIALSVSYQRNRTYVRETAAEITKLDQVPRVAQGTPLESVLPRLEAVRRVVDVANRYRDDTPWSMRWGLYQGNSVGNAARDAYVREIEGTLLPRVAARIEDRLKQYAPEPEKLFEYLKAYLMLGEPKRLDRQHLKFVADLEWNAADTAHPDAAAALSKHFDGLLEYRSTLRPVAMDPTLLAQATNTLRQASIPQIVYNRFKRTYKDDRARAVPLDQAAGVGVERVIRRKSGASLSEPVPSLFSRPVFQEVTSRNIPDLVKQFAADDWVWGQTGAMPRSTNLTAEVIDLYERDYIGVWDRILNDLELVPFSSSSQAIESLEILSRSTSPLRGLLTAVVDNTSLVQQGDASKPTDAASAAKKSITDRIGQMKDKYGGLFGQQKDGRTARVPGALVSAEFQPIHRLLAGEPGSTPLDAILLRIGQIAVQLKSLSAARGGDSLGGLTDPNLRDIVRSLQQEAEALPPMIQGLLAQIGRKAEVSAVSGATSELERRYRQEVLQECGPILAGRYPFSPQSNIDLPLRDFSNLFGINGLFDKFFNDNLERLVDRSRSPWTWQSGAPNVGRGILEQFEAARQIRDLFFRRGTGAFEVRFYVTVTDVDAAAIRFVLDIDGLTVEHKNPPRSLIAVWPGSTGAASMMWEEKYGGKPRLARQGPWAWFRLLDAGKEEPESDVRSKFSYEVPAHFSRITIEATSVLNPFSNRRWQQFKCEF